MDVLQLTFIAVLIFGGAALIYILVAKPSHGNATLAAMLAAGFGAYTAVQIAQEGVIMFWTNHTVNLTGIQVWWDLVMCVMIALFFIAPRARAANMNLVPWALFVGCTASIGLLAMIARLFWLENQSEARAEASATPVST
ncbi:MAG: hypothetical protein AAF941_07010 [Pseudomonadota bacterium]